MRSKSAGVPTGFWKEFVESLERLSAAVDAALAAVRSAEETRPDAPD